MKFGTELLTAVLAADPGEETPIDPLTECLGKTIKAVHIDARDDLCFEFADGVKVTVTDEPSCCESRYMHTDDDLKAFAWSTLVDVSLRDGVVDIAPNGEVRETAFFHVQTNMGAFVVACYNDHNGYYGGISPKAEYE